MVPSFLLLFFLSEKIFQVYSSQETTNCRIHNHLFVCINNENILENVIFEDANAVQTIEDIELHLENLNIIALLEKSLTNVKNTTALYLSENKLSIITRYFFQSLDQLTYLDLRNNIINDIEEGAFLKLTNLETLLLDGNYISKLGPITWKGLTNLHELYVTNNTIILRKNMFRGLKQLETLALDSNEISEIPLGTFNGLPHIDLLYLSRNEISSLYPDVFKGLHQVNELDLSKNKLNSISNGLFRSMKTLDSLWLNDNHLVSIQIGAFDGLENLLFLFLSGNELESIDMSIFISMKNVSVEPGFIIDGSLATNLTILCGILRCERVLKGYRQDEFSKPHPGYRSTSMDYGWYCPTVHTVPTCFYPRTGNFTTKLSRAGMYRNHSLNTELDKTFY